MASEQHPMVRRPYRSPGREAAARSTRRRIQGEARRLFLESGYVGTSVRAIARAAGVAEKTVYLQFETKPAILKAVVESAIVGDDDAVPAASRQWFLEVVAEARLDRKIALLTDATSALHERTGPVFAVAREAAAVDPEVAVLWSHGKRGHLADMTAMAESFADQGLLPAGLDAGWATELLYVLLGPENWHLIRHELERDEQHYRDWLRTTLTQALREASTRRP